jgi:hypothetical protein
VLPAVCSEKTAPYWPGLQHFSYSHQLFIELQLGGDVAPLK